MYEILCSMGMKIKLPIVCRVDNIGAIFIAENATACPKSKHIDIRAKYVTKFIADGFLKVVFVKTDENMADIFTKNVSSELQDKHRENFVWNIDEMADDT